MPKENEKRRTEIRTRLTYCLPAGIKDFEWETIINNVETLIDAENNKFKVKVGILRQLLNEDRIDDPYKAITNEEILKVLE